MADAHAILDDILQKITSLHQEFDRLLQTEQVRKQAEKSLFRQNKLAGMYNSVRSAIVEYTAPEDLYRNICRSFVESGLIIAAWVGRLDPEMAAAVPTASARVDAERIAVTGLHPDENAPISGPIIDTVSKGEIFYTNRIDTDNRLTIFQSAADRQGYRSLAAFPISGSSSHRGILTLYSTHEDLFSDAVLKDIQTVCRELSIALRRTLNEESIRSEIADLRDELNRRRVISDEEYLGTAVIRGGVIVYANKALARILGYSVDEILAWGKDEFLKIVHPDDAPAVADPRRRVEREMNGVSYYSYRIIARDGTVRRIHRYSKTFFYEGVHAYLVAVIDSSLFPESPVEAAEPEKLFLPQQDAAGDIFSTIFEESPFPAFLADFNTLAIQQANRAARDQYRYTAEELAEIPLRNLFPDDEIAAFMDTIIRLPLIGQLEIITKHQLRDGTTIDVEVAARYIQHADTPYILLFARDVTNTKWAEDVIRESEANYRNVFNSVGYMLLVIDREARILDINRAAAHRLQRQREDVLGKSFNLINAEDLNDTDRFRAHLARAFETGEERVEWQLQRRDGDRIYVELLLHRGEYFGHDVVVAAARRKDDLTTIRQAPEVLNAALESAPSALAIADADGMFTWANQAFTSLTGYTIAELQGMDFRTMLPEDKNGDYIDRIWGTVTKGFSWSDEITIESKLHKRIQAAVTITPVKIRDEPVSRYIIAAKNVGEEKERVQQLLQRQKMESIDTISRAIAHDFNNILGIILGYASFLEKRKDDPEKLHSDVAEIKTAVQRGADLIKQMIAYTHRNDVIFEEIDINDAVRDVVSLLSETIPESIDLLLELDEAMPPVFMARNQFEQIITEICLNARDAILGAGERERRERDRIMIQTRRYRGAELRAVFPSAHEFEYAEIRISDTGTGMDEETRNRVFDPFFSAKNYGKGKGLGLTAVYGCVKSYGGFIRVESEPGGGATFVIYLPAKNGSSDDKDQSPPTTRTAGQEIHGNKILIVEDEPSLLQLLRHILEDNGFQVVTARDGIEAVRLYEKHKTEIVLVVSDVGLPKLDGFNAYLQMRRINPNVQAILASGYLDDKVKSDLSMEGIKDFIMKPYKAEEILAKIKERVQSR